jgi:hypothetical protein
MTKPKDPADHKRMGRPTNYREEYCDLVVELGSKGWSKAEIALEIAAADYSVLDDWGRRAPNFAKAMVRARNASLAWWEAEGRGKLGVRDFNGNLYRICMQRFPEYKQAALVEVVQPSPGIDLAKLSPEDRAALGALLQRAKLEQEAPQPYTVRAEDEKPPDAAVH